jgi:hypothetical protein
MTGKSSNTSMSFISRLNVYFAWLTNIFESLDCESTYLKRQGCFVPMLCPND